MSGDGLSGGLLLVTIQALLSDHHGERRAIALTEANVAASVAYVVLIGALSLAAATGAGWRVALLASLPSPLAWRLNRDVAISRRRRVRRRRAAFRRRSGSRRRCSSARPRPSGASPPGARASSRTPPTFRRRVGVADDRLLRWRRPRAHRRQRPRPPPQPAPPAGDRVVVTAAGFAILWPAASPLQALLGLTLLGVGLGNLFPLGLAVTVALAPDRALLASGRAVFMTSFAVLLAPLTVGALADATSLTTALAVVPVALALAATGLTLVTRSAKVSRGKGTVPLENELEGRFEVAAGAKEQLRRSRSR